MKGRERPPFPLLHKSIKIQNVCLQNHVFVHDHGYLIHVQIENKLKMLKRADTRTALSNKVENAR